MTLKGVKMVRISKEIEHHRIEELKKKISDKDYLDFAIHKIAQALAHEISLSEQDEHGVQQQ